MMGAAFRAPLHSMVESCLRRVEQLLKEPFDANLKVAAACMLHCYANVAMDPEAERIANLVAQPLLSSPNLSTPYALRYWHAEGYTHYLHGRYTQALAIFHSADTIARELSFPDISYWWIQRGLCERRAGLLDQAEETIHRLESATFPAGEHFHGGLYLLKASVAFDRGDMHQAIEHILRSYRSFDKVAHFNGKVLVGTVASNMAIAGSRFDVASQILGRLRGEEYGSIAENYLAAIGLNEAWLAHRRGDFDRRNESLREALLRSADGRARERLRWYPNAMTELLPVAFDLEIEPEIASQLAREFNVVPAANAPENWPWPVKVYTLGRFELLIDGRRPEYSRKVPKKVLALLKAIIAQGGKDVPEQKLIDTLWSDEEGDAARRALVTTLHRLRKLLGHMKAIQQTGGELSLDEGICWIDARAFERCIDGLETGQDGPHGATRLYLGAFLHQDEGASWTIPTRERLRDKFIRAVGKFGEALENSDQYEAAIDLYSRGIHADPLIEPFYQGLMRCYDKLNRRAEAASAYRRLRETLSIVLGVTPSSASQRLFESLRLS
jgi:DNA-binding SARP family transcriptional activator